MRQTLERDLRACAQGNVSVRLHRLDELEGQPVAHFHGTCIDDQDISIDNYQFTTDYLQHAVSGEASRRNAGQPSVEIQLPDHPPTGLGLDTNSVSRAQNRQEKLLRYLVSFRHHNEFHEQCVERIFNDILRFCQPETLSVYARYTRRGGLDINPGAAIPILCPPRAGWRDSNFLSILRAGLRM